MKRSLSLFLSIVMLFSMFSVIAIAQEEAFASGVIVAADGREFNWEINSEYGCLYIEGEGAMPAFPETAPWLEYNFSSVSIGKGIESVSDEAFLGAEYLGVEGRVLLPDSLSRIGDRVFYGCKSLDSFSFEGISSIGAMAFYGCEKLFDYFIPETVEEIGAYSIGYYCNEEADDEFAKIDGVKIYSFIGSPAHSYALENGFEFVDLNDYSAFFGYEAFDEESVILTSFSGCDYSKDITVPSFVDGFKVIGLGAFLFENSDVEKVRIPSSIEKIHNTAFLNARELQAILVEDGGRFGSFDGCLYDSGLETLYKAPEAKEDVSFSDSLKTIGREAFRGSLISRVALPEGVESIGEGAFSYSAIREIELNEKVSIIPDWAFASCDALCDINLSRVKVIGENAFRDCGSLFSVSLNESVETIDAAAFYGTNLSEIIIPESVKEIGEKAFGYYFENDVEFVKREGFVISGKVGSASERYAEENGFEFVDFAPVAPNIYYAYADTTAVSLFWEQVPEAEYYEIYRRVDSGNYKKIAISQKDASLVYVDTAVENGVSYTYSVLSVKSGIRSNFDNETTVDFVVLAAPEMKSAEMTREGILVKWGAVEGAQGYSLYRRADKGWSRIAEFKGSVKSYVDSTAKSGVEYDYTVKAYCDDIESRYDTEGVSAVYLDIPKLKKIENASNGIKITWGKVKGADAYIIGRKTSKGSWEKIATVGDVASFTDKKAKAGTTYAYTVVSVKGSVKGFYDESGLAFRFIEMPKVKSVSNTDSGIKLSWAKVSKSSGYIVYRKTVDGSWVKLKKIKDSAVTSFVDKSAKSGVKYVYALKAYSSSYVSAYKAVEIVRLSTPKLVSAKSTKNGINFKWEEVKGAEGYYVYRITGKGSWEKIAKVKNGKSVTYLDKSAKKGITYKYMVKAYNGSYKSAYVSKGLSVKDKY